MVWSCEEKRGYLCWKKDAGNRKVGRSKRRFMDKVKEGMKDVGVNEGDVHDRRNWRRKSAVATPSRIGSSRKKMKKKIKEGTGIKKLVQYDCQRVWVSKNG